MWTYWVQPDREADFRRLLSGHWPTLHRLGFVLDEEPTILRSVDDPPIYIEIFTWAPEGMRPAHNHPDVIPVWEGLKALVEDRNEDRNVPGMTFPFYRRITLPTS